MSRIGKKPIAIPAGVEVKIDGNVVEVKGNNGTLKQSFRPEINIAVENGEIIVALVDDSATVKTFYKENGHYRLQPENKTMKPIIVDSLLILGKVISVMRLY